jgi:hypothetical protein
MFDWLKKKLEIPIDHTDFVDYVAKKEKVMVTADSFGKRNK